jgi:hypothetical protein
MRSTYQGLPQVARQNGSHRRHGLTDPGVIADYVDRRVADPALLSSSTGPSYADFFVAPAL